MTKVGLVTLFLLPLAGYWLWPATESRTHLLATLGLAALVVGGAYFYLRLQAQRRYRIVWDAYAERVLTRHIRHKRPSVRGTP
jgi:hypothetical protein